MREQSDTVARSEFESWLTPPEALKSLEGIGGYGTRVDALVERLAAGLATAAAETYRVVRYRNEVFPRAHWLIPKSVWDENAPRHGYSKFWETGQFTFSETEFQRPDTKHSYFGVRFDPEGVEGLRRASGLTSRVITPAVFATPPPAADERPHLSKADAERFCQAILAGWPDASQDFAHKKATLFFLDKRVPRDQFRSILRSIRGHTKPGKKPKDTE